MSLAVHLHGMLHNVFGGDYSSLLDIPGLVHVTVL